MLLQTLSSKFKLAMSDSKVSSFTITNTSSLTYNVAPPPGTAAFQIQASATSPSLTAAGTYTVTDFNTQALQFTVILTSAGQLTITPTTGSSNGATVTTTIT
jgi:hypothetical protein